jgi:DnaJ family protein A protein 2
MYDVGGFDPLNGGAAGASGYDADMEEMMAHMFAQMGTGGGAGPQFMFEDGGFPGFGGARNGPGQKKRKRNKGLDEVQDFEVTLEDLYKGKTKRFAATKKVVCAHCKGTGGKEKAKKIQCGSCRGQGLWFKV